MMKENEIVKAFDILDKFEFFSGQRAGRERWFNKPTDIQNKDIGGFLRDLDFLKQFINRQQAEIEWLNGLVKSLEELCETKTALLADANWSLITARAEAVKEFAENLIRNVTLNNTNDGYLDYAIDYYCLVEDINDLVKEMVGEGK